MITFRDFLNESKIDYVDGPQHLIRLLKKDQNVKKYIGKQPMYFDGSDLVLGDKTVMHDPIFDDGTVDFESIVKAVVRTAKDISVDLDLAGYGKPKADETSIGRFNIKLPKEMAGTLGGKNIKLENPRAIIDANDVDANLIKKMLHSPKNKVKVRIMKRSSGNKVYIDAQDQDNFNNALELLKDL